MNTLVLFIILLTSYLALTIAFAAMPYISRKTLSFGIAIPEIEYKSEKVVAIRSKYRNAIMLTGFVFFVLVVALVNYVKSNSLISFIFGIMLLANMVANGVIYYLAHKKTKELKSENRWSEHAQHLVTVSTDLSKNNNMVSPLWFTLSIFVIAITVIVSLIFYDTLPSKIPLKFNAAGEVIKYADKSYRVLLAMPVVQLFIVVISVFVYYAIANSKQQINPKNPNKSLAQNIEFRKRWSVFSVLFGLLLLLMFAVTQFSIIGLLPHKTVLWGTIVVTALIILGTVWLALITGQSGSRVKVHDSKDANNIEMKNIVRDDDNLWRLGVFYYNPDDPTLFVEKRFGIGWTLNFGRGMSWVILCGILGLTAVAVLLTTLLTK